MTAVGFGVRYRALPLISSGAFFTGSSPTSLSRELRASSIPFHSLDNGTVLIHAKKGQSSVDQLVAGGLYQDISFNTCKKRSELGRSAGCGRTISIY